MGDKRLMDNKVVKNPLLSGVDQASFVQDFVQSSLLIPAAPSKLPQATTDTPKGPEKKLEKTAVSDENKPVAATIPTIRGPTPPSGSAVIPAVRSATPTSGPSIISAVRGPSPASTLGSAIENSQQIAHPVLFPPNQNIAVSPAVKATSSLTEIPLDGSISSGSFLNQSLPENTEVNPPPKLSGPPPLTTYNRPFNKLSSSRYPSASYLQTIPSAQFVSQSNSVLPSASPQNFSKSTSSSPPIAYFVPQQQAFQQPVSVHSSSLLNQASGVQICPPTSQYSLSTTLYNSNKTSGSAETSVAANLSKSESLTAPILQAAHPSVLTPVNVTSPLPQSFSLPSNITSAGQGGINPSVPSLPVSQPIIVPALLPSSSVGISGTSHSQNSTVSTTAPSSVQSTSSVSITSHDNLISKSISNYNPASVSSSILSSTSPSPQPPAPPENSSSVASSSSVFSPAVLELSNSESAVSLKSNIAHVNPSSSNNISQGSLIQTISANPSASPFLTSTKQQNFIYSLPSSSAITSTSKNTDPSSTTQTLSSVTASNQSSSQINLSNSQLANPPSVSNIIKPPPSTLNNFASVPSTNSVSTTTLTSVGSSISQQILKNPKASPADSSSLLTSSVDQNFELTTASVPLLSSSVSSSDKNLSSCNKDNQHTSSTEVVTSSDLTSTPIESQTKSDSFSAPTSVASTSSKSQSFQSDKTLSTEEKSENLPLFHLPLSESLSVRPALPNPSFVNITTSAQSFPIASGNNSSLLPETTSINPPVCNSSQFQQITTAFLQTSSTFTQQQPSLFTFTTPTSSTDFSNLSHPPSQPYNNSLFSALQASAVPKSTSAPDLLPSVPPTAAFSQSLSFSIPKNSPVQHKESSNISPSLTSPPLLDPSKFFSTSSLANTFEHSSVTNSQEFPTSPQPITTTGFTPLPTRKFASPQSLSGVFQPPPPNPTIPGKDSSTSQSISTFISPPPSTAAPSLTPPPPYSSLPFKSGTTEAQNHQKEKFATPETAQVEPDGGTGTFKNIDVKEEELDQIPLDGNIVPLYNPFSVGALPQHTSVPPTKGNVNNTYRLGGGLKRPSYAPIPDLGITHNLTQVFTTLSNPPPAQMSTTTIAAVTTPSTTPSSSVTSSPPPESASFNYSVTAQGQIYRPPYHHWFFKKGDEKKANWQPFSMADSLSLEQVFTSPDLNENTKVPTDGGRYDVEVMRRRKLSVYWEEPPGDVRRCSWFVRAPIESRYIPYDENIAEILEDAYKTGCLRNEWNRRVELADGEVIILHSPNAMAHHQRSSSPDAWGNPPAMQQKPRLVKRGLEDVEISEGEPNQVDHLLLMVHGIGKVCDLRFRSLVQVVDDFRSVSLQLVQSHFRSGITNGNVGRVEILPVEWHRALHTETIDKRLADITLPSIPKAREFTNDVLLDILFYTSPVFCERIVQAVGAEINRVYNLYMTRNPGFRGGVSLGGHSLGSLILFDMLCHQKPQRSIKSNFSPQSSIQESDEDLPELGCLKAKARLSRRMSYLTIGSSGTGQPYIVYPQLNFQPKAFFALGSPIGMFLTVRGIEGLGEEFKFPTCPKFFNIFHPNDPVAYRIEALIKAEMAGVPAVVIPHHKGRKRMHLELKETMTHVTAALKQKLIDSMRSTWNTVYQLAMFHRPDSSIQQEVDKVIENEILTNNQCETANSNQLMISDQEALDMKVGILNGGNRIDYVLQEAPLETFNQYISAVRSHVVYWESLDTMLLILKELYATIGISPDSQVPQPILPFDISSDNGNETYSEYTDSIGAPPTQFVRK